MTRTTLIGRTAIGGAGLLCGCLLVAACSSSGPAHKTAGGVPANSGAQLGMHAASGAEAAAPRAAGTNPSAAGRQAHTTAHLAPADQSIIYTASLTMRAADVMSAAKHAAAIATAAGGYVADEHAVSGPSGRPRGSVELTLKIPVPSYQAALTQLSSPAIGTQLALQQQATDVTQEVANVSSLVTSQQDAISALQGLLKRAGSVSGLLQVQQQISSDESNLNALQAQQRALNHETAYGTVSMTLVSPAQPVRHHRHKPTRRGFLTGLAAGWRAIRHTAAWLATAVGVILPFLIVVIVLAGAGYAARRRLLRRRAAG